ncbi:hypothetical protein [Streptantibioticus ferralitis]|uniref:Uncharacterized protein n=1 Tax=Streptantibioticus ferralitis TaxID=236510 RepID=A0ABT5ZC69_9ACTN|nr:hypothetical protein [Streptantibioticus ferralitis]MDF2261445.1 hypothetical protein [Streptantibioticus ferralitis]
MTSTMKPDADLVAARTMRHLLYGQLISRALCAVTEAGVPELIRTGGPEAPRVGRRL